MNIQKFNLYTSFKGAMEISGEKPDVEQLNTKLQSRANSKNPFIKLPNPQKLSLEKTIVWSTKEETSELNGILFASAFDMKAGESPAKHLSDKVRKFMPSITKYSAKDVLEAIKKHKFDFKNMRIK